MRLDWRTPGFHREVRSAVTVDGIDVSGRCFLADEEAGEAHCYVSTLTPVLDEHGDLATEVLRGEVRISFPGREAVEALASRVQSSVKWVSVEECLPLESTDVLVRHEDGACSVGEHSRRRGWTSERVAWAALYGEGPGPGRVTHWTEIPPVARPEDGAEWLRFLTESGGGWCYSPQMLQDEGARLLRILLPYARPGETASDTLERLLGLDRLGGPQ